MKRGMVFLTIVGVILTMAAIVGCNVIASTLLTYTTTGGTDIGRLTSPEAVVAGTATVSGSSVTVNLGSIIVGGTAEAKLTAANFKIFVGTTPGAYSTYTAVSTGISKTSGGKMDMVFVLDNTGSMSGRIVAAKNSIIAFATSLEAAGADVKFGVVSFGDTPSEQSALPLPATADSVKTFLTSLSGVGGGDIPENDLDSIMYANDSFTWRTGAQKIYVVITDTCAHQTGDGTTFTARTLATVQTSLEGRATVYVVSPKLNSGSGPDGYPGTADMRWLADGYGWFSGVTASAVYGTTRPYTGTGGKWVELPYSGDIDLTTLGIATTVTEGYTMTFTYTVTGALYIHVLIDYNGDGVYDVDGVITFGVTGSSAGKYLPSGELADPADRIRSSKN